MTSPRIAIIGGGPGGLTLARLLQLKSIPFDLFELDPSPHSRSQGGTLDIHRDAGQIALNEAGLFPEFQRHARHEAATLKILGKDGTIAWADNGGELDDRPEIDRVMLRSILLNSLENGSIKWGRKVVDVSEDATSSRDSPKFNIRFEDGIIEQGYELVVGADGTWSRVRGLVTNEKPFYSGITAVEAGIDAISDKYPDLAQRVGAGSCFQFGSSNGLQSQRLGDGSIKTYATVRVPEEWAATCGIDWNNDEKSKADIIEQMYKGWDVLGRDMILRSEGPLVVRPLYMLPVEMKWQTRPGVTLIGDAAHVMTPFAGVGVNLALTDALDLSHAIVSHVEEKVDWHTALREFEEKMLTRSRIEAGKTFANMNIMFSGDDAQVIARRLGEVMGVGQDEVVQH